MEYRDVEQEQTICSTSASLIVQQTSETDTKERKHYWDSLLESVTEVDPISWTGLVGS